MGFLTFLAARHLPSLNAEAVTASSSMPVRIDLDRPDLDDCYHRHEAGSGERSVLSFAHLLYN